MKNLNALLKQIKRGYGYTILADKIICSIIEDLKKDYPYVVGELKKSVNLIK